MYVGKRRINHPFGNGLYHLFMVIWGMVYIAIVVGTLEQWSDDYLTCWMEILRHLEKTQHIRCFK